MTLYRGEAAIWRMRHVTDVEVGFCLRVVRQQYGIPAKYPSAAEAWRNAKHRHSSQPPPRGYPCFWLGGSSSNGHVAISTGQGWILSTDLPVGGKVGRVWWTEPAKQWGLTYAGWTTDLNDEGVWCPSVDLSKIQKAATGDTVIVGDAWKYPYGTTRVQTRLRSQGLLASRFVNGYWGDHTDEAWRAWCKRAGVTIASKPSSYALKRLGAHDPYMIVRP